MASARDLLHQLESGLDNLMDGDNFRNWLRVQARFHQYSQYSFGNVLLIAVHCPDATRVAGFHAWKKLGRPVKKGERGIPILAPVTYKTHTNDARLAGDAPTSETDDESTRVGFRVVYVFDISQTDGPPLPELTVHGLEGADAGAFWLRDQLLTLAATEGLTVDLAATDCAAAAGFFGYYQRSSRKIHVAQDCSPNQTASTLAHEMGHHLLGHGGHAQDSRHTAEVQAESFGYILCATAGLATDDKALPYIAGWADGDTPEAKRQAIRAALTPVHDAVAACLKRLSLNPTNAIPEVA